MKIKKVKMFKEGELDKLTLKELEELEAKVILECDEVNNEAGKAELDLPKENYEIAAEAIKYFLNQKKVSWQYALVMTALYDFWDSETRPDKIPYPQLDTILRTLGESQFDGYEEWVKVIAINKYFEPLIEPYKEITQAAFDAATKHQMVMEAMDKLTEGQSEKNEK